jgi:hypothetical protein
VKGEEEEEEGRSLAVEKGNFGEFIFHRNEIFAKKNFAKKSSRKFSEVTG